VTAGYDFDGGFPTPGTVQRAYDEAGLNRAVQRYLTPRPQDTTPDGWEDNLRYWEALQAVVDTEPPFDGYRVAYGELAALGIAQGQPFGADEGMRSILQQALVIGNAQMRAQSFADRRPPTGPRRVARPALGGAALRF
jgi:hypothetical protein